MDVSVIVPTRNRRVLLTTTLRSVLRQQDVDLEVIVVDDGSTDDTAGVVAALGDKRVRMIRHETPRGVSAARNLGAAEGRAEWLAFLDDDDLWAPDKVFRQLHAATAAGRDWAYTGAVHIIEDCRIVSGRPPLAPEEVVAALPRYDAIPGGGSNVIVRRPTWLLAGPFDSRLRNPADWEMWIRLAQLGPPACVWSPLVARRLHSENLSFDIADIMQGTRLIEALHHTRADWGRLHRWMAHSCLRAGHRRSALGQFVKAAARGEIRNVVSDLALMLKARIVGESDTTLPNDAYIQTAAAWLQDFQGSAREFDDEVPLPATAAGPGSFPSSGG